MFCASNLVSFVYLKLSFYLSLALQIRNDSIHLFYHLKTNCKLSFVGEPRFDAAEEEVYIEPSEDTKEIVCNVNSNPTAGNKNNTKRLNTKSFFKLK